MWATAINAMIGIWLMASPAIVNTFSHDAANNNRIFGPLIVAFGVMALWEVLRSVRYVNTGVGIWILFSTILLGYSDLALVTNLIAAVAIIGLSLVRGEQDVMKFGGGWVALWDDDMLARGQSTESAQLANEDHS